MNAADSHAAGAPEPSLEDLVGDWIDVPDLAGRWDVPVTRVHTMISDGRLLAGRIGERQVRAVPALFITEEGPLETLRGTATVLKDAGFTDEQAIRWLYTDDDSLPGRPVDALRAGRKTEVRRRAQVLAW